MTKSNKNGRMRRKLPARITPLAKLNVPCADENLLDDDDAGDNNNNNSINNNAAKKKCDREK